MFDRHGNQTIKSISVIIKQYNAAGAVKLVVQFAGSLSVVTSQRHIAFHEKVEISVWRGREARYILKVDINFDISCKN